MKYAEISKETIGLLHQSYASLQASSLSPILRVLVELRVSQINGCAYCCRLHSNEARKIGINQDKLDLLTAWANSSAFSAEEKLALQWAEVVTKLSPEVSRIREQLSKTFSERDLVDLTASISIMNALNRLAISLQDF